MRRSQGMQYLYDVYLAGPFFNEGQVTVMDEAKKILQEQGLTVADPRELGPNISQLPASERNRELYKQIFLGNIEALDASKAIVACIDDRDQGTAFEIGYFRKRSRQVVTFSGHGYGANVMLSQATALHFHSLDELRAGAEALAGDILTFSYPTPAEEPLRTDELAFDGEDDDVDDVAASGIDPAEAVDPPSSELPTTE